jgi:malonyl-CoA O-methyltransferase
MAHDHLAEEVGQRMLERLDVVRLSPQLVVDVGCGGSASLAGLAARFPNATVVGFDIACDLARRFAAQPEGSRSRWLPRWLAVLAATRPTRVGVADSDRLPLADGTVDCIWSNLALHRHGEPRAVFVEWNRALRAEGLVQFSTLGPDTLKELRAATVAAGEDRVHRFADMHDLGDMLVDAGFADPVMDMETITLTYPDLKGLLADLRAAGATNARRGRSRGLAGPRWLDRAAASYEAARQSGALPATFEIVYGHAWKPSPIPGRPRDGTAVIRPGDIVRSRRRV